MSSSAISTSYVLGPCGSIGPSGRIGNTGNSGNTGIKGDTGSIGVYYSGFSANNNEITLQFSDGRTILLRGTFRGATTEDRSSGAIIGENGTGISLLKDIVGGTFNLRGICAYGSLRASLTGSNNEYISIDTTFWGLNKLGNYDATTMTPNKLIYLKDPFTINGASLGYRTENSDQNWRNPFDFSNFHLNTGSKIVTLGPVLNGRVTGIYGGPVSFDGVGTTLGIFLNTNDAGVFILKTPIGIQGITGTFYKGEIASITLLFESDNVWSFPENIYFEPNENYLSCGKNIIGLFTYDGGDTWIANVSHRGHGIADANRQCVPGSIWGSCCYTNPDNTLGCLDYVDRTVCDRLSGTFNPALPCERSCGYDISTCCNGLGECLSNVSLVECQKFGGSYWPGVNCFRYNNDGGNYEDPVQDGRFCYDTCGTDYETFCCKNGQCLGKYTRVQCELILGGRGVTADLGSSCSDIDCCDYSTVNGACCICTTQTDGSITSNCENNKSLVECRALNGIFMGGNKQCNEVSCGCVCATPVVIGACCVNGTCSSKSVDECAALNGTFWGPNVSCECVLNCTEPSNSIECSPVGACCLGTVCTNTSQVLCEYLGGVFNGSLTNCTDNTNYCNSLCGDSICQGNPCENDNPPSWCSGGNGGGGGSRNDPYGCCCNNVTVADAGSQGEDTGFNLGYNTRRADCGGRFYGGMPCSAVCTLCDNPPCAPLTCNPPPCVYPQINTYCQQNPTKCYPCLADPDQCTLCGICPECWACVGIPDVDPEDQGGGDDEEEPPDPDPFGFGGGFDGNFPDGGDDEYWAGGNRSLQIQHDKTPIEQTVKLVINNEEFCLPVICRGDCGGYTLCE